MPLLIILLIGYLIMVVINRSSDRQGTYKSQNPHDQVYNIYEMNSDNQPRFTRTYMKQALGSGLESEKPKMIGDAIGGSSYPDFSDSKKSTPRRK